MLVSLSRGQEGGRPLSHGELTFQSSRYHLIRQSHSTRPSITESIITALRVLRYKCACTEIPLPVPYDHVADWLVGDSYYHFQSKKQEAQSYSESVSSEDKKLELSLAQ